MDERVDWLQRLAYRAMEASAVLYVLLHLLLVAALVTFGARAGGYPVQPLALGAYGLPALAGTALVLRVSGRSRTSTERLLPWLALALFLGVCAVGMLFATEVLGQLGLRAAYPPWLDDDGAFALLNVGLAIWVVALALAARWRRLLVAGMMAQGLALLLNPGLLWGTIRCGLVGNALPLMAISPLYGGALAALGWRPRHLRRAPVLLLAGALLAVLLVVPLFGAAIPLQATGEAASALMTLVIALAAAAFCLLVFGLPLFAWRLRAWASEGDRPPPLATIGVALALLAAVAASSVRWVMPGQGVLPGEGQDLGWIGKTVPAGAYGLAGSALTTLGVLHPWLLAVTGLAWLLATGQTARRLGLRGAARRLGLTGGLALLGLGMLLQNAPLLLPLPWPPPIHGFAGALVQALDEPGLSWLPLVGCTLAGLGLVCLSSLLREETRRRGWLTLGATLLALFAALLLTGGLLAGTLLGAGSLQQISTPSLRHEAMLRLALSVPANAALVVLGWWVAGSGRRTLTAPAGDAGLPRPVLWRAFALAVLASVAGAVALWQLTALPVAETWPRDGETAVATNAAIHIRLLPGQRNWGPGVMATYADTGGYVPGGSGGSAAGEVWFLPEGGWRPNATVNVRVCCGRVSRKYEFSFTTGAGPSADVAPVPDFMAGRPVPTPMPTSESQ